MSGDEEPTGRMMPVVGGPRDGEVLRVPPGRFLVRLVMPMKAERDRQRSPEIFTLMVRKFCCIMPARTDRQMFPVLVHHDFEDAEAAWHAVVVAWANGWSPPDSTSESQWNPADWRSA